MTLIWNGHETYSHFPSSEWVFCLRLLHVEWSTPEMKFCCTLMMWYLSIPGLWSGPVVRLSGDSRVPMHVNGAKDTVRWYTYDMISFYHRLMVGSCGSAQWRLQGPNSWSGAKETVRKVPVTEMMHYSGLAVLVLVPLLVYWLLSVLRFIFTWHGGQSSCQDIYGAIRPL